MATRVRKDVWKLPITQGQVWSDAMLWYARGVGALMGRPITDPTSWNSLGAIHGYDPQLWADFGFVTGAPPTSPLWQQCQHQTWYFLPWHRGYLAAEAILRAHGTPQVFLQADLPPDGFIQMWLGK